MEIKPTCKCLSDLVPLGWIFSSPGAYKVCSDDDPRLTLTFLMATSNLLPDAVAQLVECKTRINGLTTSGITLLCP